MRVWKSIEKNPYGLDKISPCPCGSGEKYFSCCVHGEPSGSEEFEGLYGHVLPDPNGDFVPLSSYKDEILPRFSYMKGLVEHFKGKGAEFDKDGALRPTSSDVPLIVPNQRLIDGIIVEEGKGVAILPELAEGFMLGNDLAKGEEAFFWHGTTTDALPRILSEGLKLNQPSNYRFEPGMVSSFGIYLTTGLAPYYAIAKISRWRPPNSFDDLDGAILKIRIDDVSRLIGDEDVDFFNDIHERIEQWKDREDRREQAEIIEANYQKKKGTNHYFPKISKWPPELRYDTLCSKSLRRLGSVRCLDDIPPENIVEVYTFRGRLFSGCTEFAEITLPVKDLLTPKEFVAVKHQEMIYLNMIYNKKKPATSKDTYRFIMNVGARQLSQKEIADVKALHTNQKKANEQQLKNMARTILGDYWTLD